MQKQDEPNPEFDAAIRKLADQCAPLFAEMRQGRIDDLDLKIEAERAKITRAQATIQRAETKLAALLAKRAKFNG